MASASLAALVQFSLQGCVVACGGALAVCLGEELLADVGAGVVDYPGILRRAAGTVEHLFVEHDEPADAFESARASLEYLRTIEE